MTEERLAFGKSRQCIHNVGKPHVTYGFFVRFSSIFEVLHNKTVRPFSLVEVEEHLLLKFILAVGNSDGVVVSIEVMNESLY